MRRLRNIAQNWATFLGLSLSLSTICGCGDEPTTQGSSSGTGMGTGGEGGSTNTGGNSGAGGMGTGGMGTGGMGTGGMGTGGMGTGGMGTGGMGMGGMGTGGMAMPVCGDGVVDGSEECDDGNATSTDGCTDSCIISTGYTCTGSPSNCVPVCGDGLVIGGEACDDMNTTAGDGCNATCAVESGYTCTGMPSVCTPMCGDGIIAGAELCDGMNLNNQTCMTMGFGGGMLSCSMMCTFDTSGCILVEACNNGQDDDNDGEVDCGDTDCTSTPPCDAANETICNDFNDNDNDGLTDCEDPDDCKGLAVCQSGMGATGTPCDSPADCASNNMDPFCIDQPQYGWPAGYCSEFCDLATNDCAAGGICVQAGAPSGAGLCLDLCATQADCRMGYECVNFGPANVCFPVQEDCTNMVDDNQNGLTDCADPACQGDPACLESNCTDMIDNDQDGQADCMDSDCQNDPACLPPEICSGGIDEDQDGWIDCQDADCASDPGCDQGLFCMNAIPLSDGVPYSGTTVGGTSAFEGSCTGGSGSFERIFVFTPGMMGQNGVVTITLSSATDQGIYVRSNCIDPGSQIDCTDQFGGGTDEQLIIPAQGGVPLTIFVDGWFDPTFAGPFIVTATFSMTVCGNGIIEAGEQCDPPDGMTCDNNCQNILPAETSCNDLNDDDGDGLTDCEDPTDCKALPICQPGNTPTGGLCTLASDCVANNTDPFCIDANFGWPGGYCTEFCDMANDDCPMGSHCVPVINVPSGAGLCFDECNTVMDCRPGYQCLADGSGTNICFFQ